MELPAWDEELIEVLHRNGRGHLLKAILSLGGEATTTDAERRAGTSRKSRWKFFDDLESRGLIRKVPHARGGAGQRAHVYRLTDEGERISKALMERHAAEPYAPEESDEAGELRSQMADLSRRVAYMQEDMYGSEDGRERISELRAEVEQLEVQIEELTADADDTSKREAAIPGAEAF